MIEEARKYTYLPRIHNAEQWKAGSTFKEKDEKRSRGDGDGEKKI